MQQQQQPKKRLDFPTKQRQQQNFSFIKQKNLIILLKGAKIKWLKTKKRRGK